MPNFETGVSSYIHAQAVVDVFFPVDSKGYADISCAQCYYFKEYSKRCGLNNEICAYPQKYVGSSCPLHRLDDDTGEIIENTL
jgi:hypothetical protein